MLLLCHILFADGCNVNYCIDLCCAALDMVADSTLNTIASHEAQQILLRRIAEYVYIYRDAWWLVIVLVLKDFAAVTLNFIYRYPQLMHTNKHRVNCWIPATVAYVLEKVSECTMCLLQVWIRARIEQQFQHIDVG